MATTPYDENLTSTSPSATKDELEREIALTRAQLGETVEALSERLDVGSRAKASVSRTATRTREALQGNAARSAAVGAAVLASVVGLVVWRRRR